MNSSIIKTTDIHIIRNDNQIIRGIDWEIQPHEHWALIGCNGSGKTSLLRAIYGDLWPTTGSIWLFGQQLGFCDLPKLKKRIGWVGASIDKWLPPTETALNLVITGIYSTYELYQQPSSVDIDIAHDLLSSLNCSHIAKRQFCKLSQGEKQKVRLARSLISNPDILILDEVCAGLDINSREDLLESIEKMPITNLLYVTHHTEEIPAMTTHALIIKKGRIIHQGKKHEVINSKNMSDAFDINLQVDFDYNDRIWTKVL